MEKLRLIGKMNPGSHSRHKLEQPDFEAPSASCCHHKLLPAVQHGWCWGQSRVRAVCSTRQGWDSECATSKTKPIGGTQEKVKHTSGQSGLNLSCQYLEMRVQVQAGGGGFPGYRVGDRGDSLVVLELGSESRQHCKVCSLVSISRRGN